MITKGHAEACPFTIYLFCKLPPGMAVVVRGRLYPDMSL